MRKKDEGMQSSRSLAKASELQNTEFEELREGITYLDGKGNTWTTNDEGLLVMVDLNESKAAPDSSHLELIEQATPNPETEFEYSYD